MKNNSGYSAFNSSDVLISEQGLFVSSLAPSFFGKGRLIVSLPSHSFLGIVRGGQSTSLTRKKCRLVHGMDRIMSRERDFETLPSPILSRSN